VKSAKSLRSSARGTDVTWSLRLLSYLDSVRCDRERKHENSLADEIAGKDQREVARECQETGGRLSYAVTITLREGAGERYCQA